MLVRSMMSGSGQSLGRGKKELEGVIGMDLLKNKY